MQWVSVWYISPWSRMLQKASQSSVTGHLMTGSNRWFSCFKVRVKWKCIHFWPHKVWPKCQWHMPDFSIHFVPLTHNQQAHIICESNRHIPINKRWIEPSLRPTFFTFSIILYTWVYIAMWKKGSVNISVSPRHFECLFEALTSNQTWY